MTLRLTNHTHKEIRSLTGLRGIAILLVLLFHNFSYFQITYIGWVGVDLFFVLSGFLITRILLSTKANKHYFKNFYLRRILRIFPLYYLSILLFLIVERILSLPSGMTFSHYLAIYLIYFQNLLFFQKQDQSLGYSILNHFWTLSVEEHFYILWPWLVFYFKEKYLLLAIVLIIVGSKILSLILLHQGMSWVAIYTFSFVRFETLAMGAMVAILINYRIKLVERYTKWIFTLSCIAILTFFGYYILKNGNLSVLNPGEGLLLSQSFILSLIGFFFSSILVYSLTKNKFENFLSSKPLIFFGKYSYGIYVYHYPVYSLTAYYFHLNSANPLFFNWPVEILISIVCSFVAAGIAYVSYNYYEKYFLNLKSKFA
jgi:peptidoglycan/LPS O-acetylase OafA/YrhL